MLELLVGAGDKRLGADDPRIGEIPRVALGIMIFDSNWGFQGTMSTGLVLNWRAYSGLLRIQLPELPVYDGFQEEYAP